MSKSLNVFLNESQAGKLWVEKGQLAFQYDSDWLENDSAVPLSVSLPLQSEPQEGTDVSAYFSNLLPEADQLIAVAKHFKVPLDDQFSLLKSVAGECAGAVSIVPDKRSTRSSASYRKLTGKTLGTTINALKKQPLLAGKKGVRFSLAGTHTKLPIRFADENQSLPLNGALSDHIVKPPRDDCSDSIANEYFCMNLARRMDLEVPSVYLLTSATPLFVVNRYDRDMDDNGNIVKIHQEDFCQAMGIPPEKKHESDGGPSFKDCFDLVREYSVQPMVDLQRLLCWVVFNFFIGNEGIHAKNLAFLHTDKGPVLAPFYDLMSTAVYPSLSYRLVMKIGGEDRPNWVIKRRWQQFAKDIGMNYKVVHQCVMKMNKQLLPAAQQEAQAFQDKYGECDVIDKILALLETRCGKVKRRLSSDTTAK